MTEHIINIDRMEQAVALFGNFDQNVRLIEQHFHVNILNRDTALKITGEALAVSKAARAVEGLLQLLAKGEQLTDNPELNTENSDTEQKNKISFKWCFYFGSVITGVSLLGIIALVICSVLNPNVVLFNGVTFIGLLGFLIGRNALWFFILLMVLCVLGALTSIYGIIKNTDNNKPKTK